MEESGVLFTDEAMVGDVEQWQEEDWDAEQEGLAE